MTTCKCSKALLLTLPALLLSACGGGGGGGDDFVGAASVAISLTPRKIDTGDRARVSVDISNVYEGGVILKIRYPLELDYVNNSATFEIGRDEIDLAPLNEVSDGDETYLVFSIDRDWFDRGDDDTGTVVFELEGRGANRDAEVEVDPDVNRAEIPDSQEFDVNDPQFESEASAGIEVTGSRSRS